MEQPHPFSPDPDGACKITGPLGIQELEFRQFRDEVKDAVEKAVTRIEKNNEHLLASNVEILERLLRSGSNMQSVAFAESGNASASAAWVAGAQVPKADYFLKSTGVTGSTLSVGDRDATLEKKARRHQQEGETDGMALWTGRASKELESITNSQTCWAHKLMNPVEKYVEAVESTASWRWFQRKWECFQTFVRSQDKEWNHGWLKQRVHSNFFFIACSLIIVANTLIVAIEAEHGIREEFNRVNGKAVAEWQLGWIDNTFTLWFVLELLLRIYADRFLFVFGPDRFWNFLDAFLVLASLLELVLELVLEGPTIPDLAFLRILRMFRIARLGKVILKVKALNVLRTMLYTIANSGRVLLWALILVVLVNFTFAIVFSEAVRGHLSTFETNAINDGNQEDLNMMQTKFGGLPKIMDRLFEATSGGADWADHAEVLAQIGNVYYYVWCLYVFGMLIGILNVVTGLFVDNAVQVSLKDRNEVIMAQRDKQRQAMIDLRSIFREADVDHSQTLTWEEFKSHLSKLEVQTHFETLGISVTDLKELFSTLDRHEDGTVDITEFVGGFMHLKGSATRIDLVSLITMSQTIVDSVQEIMHALHIEGPELKIRGHSNAKSQSLEQVCNQIVPEAS